MPALPVTAAQGNPDWQNVMRTESFDLLSAYGDPGVYFAVPKSARLATRPDDSPAFFLEFFSDRNDPDIDNSLYAMVEMAIEQDGELATAHRQLGADRAGVALLPLSFTSGTYVHFECGDSHAKVPFAWEGARRATINARIALPTARLLYGALASGGVTIARAAIECEVPAVLPRVDSSVRFDAGRVLRALRDVLNPGGTSVAFDALVDHLDKPPAGLFAIEGSVVPPGSGLGLALAGRMRHFFGRSAPCPRIADGPHIELAATGDAGLTYWDLRTPLMTGVPAFLRYNPFSFLAGRTTRERVTAFTSVPLLPDELRTRHLTVASGLPADIRNCTQVTVTVRVNKDVAASGRTEGHPVMLYPAQARSTTLDLHFAKIDSPKPYSFGLRVVGESNVTDGPWVDAADDYLFVDTSQLPIGCVSLRATPALVDEATVLFVLMGADAGVDISGVLDAAHPTTSFLLDGIDPAAHRLEISARDPADPTHVLTLDLPCRSVELDTTSFREFGPQIVRVIVRFHDGTTGGKLQFAVESDDTDPIVLGFSPATPEGRFSYFATRIFKSRYRFRAYTGEGDAASSWSAFLQPGQDLHIGVYRDGPRLETAPADATGATS